MALTLVTTPAAPTANSYATVAEANAYHEGRLHVDDWDDADDAIKAAALVQAAKFLDAMPRAWTGAASTAEQAMGWPRTGMLSRNGYALASGEIPNALKDAQAEFARQLIATDRTEDNAITLQGITSVKAGSVDVKFREKTLEEGEDRTALLRRDSLEAMIPDAVIALLVPSWLKDVREEDESYTGLVFESL